VSRWTPCKRRDFIRKLQQLGFEGAFSGTRHQFMIYQQYRLTIPSNSEYSVAQLRMMLQEVEAMIGREVTLEEWNRLK
jgi:predicted RNA binding protein YcfA (HicA-like mRNA interferase family)